MSACGERRQSFLAMCVEDEDQVEELAQRVRALDPADLKRAWAASSTESRPRIENLWCALAHGRAARSVRGHVWGPRITHFMRHLTGACGTSAFPVPSFPGRVSRLHSWRLWATRHRREQERGHRYSKGKPEEDIPTSAAFIFGLLWIALMASVGHLITSTSLRPTIMPDGTEDTW